MNRFFYYLGHNQYIWFYSTLLDRKPISSPAETGLDFVYDQYDSVLVANLS